MSDTNDGTQAPQAAAGTPETTTVDYASKFNGLNRAHQKTLTEYGEFQGRYTALETEASTLREQKAALDKSKAELDATLAVEKKGREEASTRAATLEKELNRTKTLGKYPDLLAFEDKLRTDLEGEALVTYLDGFRQTLSTYAQGAVKQTLQGSLPSATPPVQGSEAVNVDSLLVQHQTLLNENKLVEADKVLSQYLALITAKKP